MAGSTLEVVIYSAKPGVSEAEMRSAVEVSNAVLRAFPGYLGRELAYASETGQWVDIVRWEDRASALAAVAAFGMQPKAQTLMDVIDLQRIRFMHLESMLIDGIEARR